MNNDKIVTPSFCYILAANFLLFFAFYLILPILPFYLKEEFMIGKSMIGFILSCYTLAALCIRPFAGYLLDTFARRPLYLVAYFIFTAIFGGYMVATALTLFIALRVVHGFAFGMVTVSGNTIVIDILPSSRRLLPVPTGTERRPSFARRSPRSGGRFYARLRGRSPAGLPPRTADGAASAGEKPPCFFHHIPPERQTFSSGFFTKSRKNRLSPCTFPGSLL